MIVSRCSLKYIKDQTSCEEGKSERGIERGEDVFTVEKFLKMKGGKSDADIPGASADRQQDHLTGRFKAYRSRGIIQNKRLKLVSKWYFS